MPTQNSDTQPIERNARISSQDQPRILLLLLSHATPTIGPHPPQLLRPRRQSSLSSASPVLAPCISSNIYPPQPSIRAPLFFWGSGYRFNDSLGVIWIQKPAVPIALKPLSSKRNHKAFNPTSPQRKEHHFAKSGLTGNINTTNRRVA